MSTVRRGVAEHNPESDGAAEAERLHELLMELVRASGMLQPDRAAPGQILSLSQAFALHELDGDVPLSQRDLAQRLRLDKSTVSRLAADLQRRQLLVRERDPANRRVYRLRLTDEGRHLHRRLAGSFHEQYRRWVVAMDPAERESLVVGLAALVRALHGGHVPHAGPFVA